MNKQLEDFARHTIKEGLEKLPERCHDLFKRMYGKLEMDIYDVVDKMDVDNLDNAMDQVQRTLVKFGISTNDKFTISDSKTKRILTVKSDGSTSVET